MLLIGCCSCGFDHHHREEEKAKHTMPYITNHTLIVKHVYLCRFLTCKTLFNCDQWSLIILKSVLRIRAHVTGRNEWTWLRMRQSRRSTRITGSFACWLGSKTTNKCKSFMSCGKKYIHQKTKEKNDASLGGLVGVGVGVARFCITYKKSLSDGF